MGRLMIEDLSIDKLIEYGFIPENVQQFREWPDFELIFYKSMNVVYWASNRENKIYSGIDAFRKVYFRNGLVNFPKDALELIPEYYEKKRELYLVKTKSLAGNIYNEKRSKERFHEQEIELTALEIDLAKKEIAAPKNPVARTTARSHMRSMEIYMDWLAEHTEPEPVKVLQPSVMKYSKEISKNEYLFRYIKDDDTMAFYQGLLKKVDPRLELTTTIYELADLFGVVKNWNEMLADRLKYAPSPDLAKNAFNEELLEIMQYDDDSSSDSEVNKERYFNKYRKVAYEYAIKGQPVTLRYLGYLILKHQCGTPEGVEVIEGIMTVFGVDRIVLSFAEGAALALFVHGNAKPVAEHVISKPILFKTGYDPNVYLDLLKAEDYKILNKNGEYIYGERKKSVITVFFDVLENNDIINYHNPTIRASLINASIPNLNITSRTLQSTTAKADSMKAYFQALIDNL